MIKYLFVLAVVLLSITAYGQEIVGQWETYDDETKEKKAVVEIYSSDDLYFAKIIESFVGDPNGVCENCTGTKKDKPIVGLTIIENIKKDGDVFNGGSILDPENGETYKCYLELVGTDKLKVRGFIGFSLFGRTQYWRRKL